MTMSVHANFPTRERGIQSQLVFGVILPFFIAAEGCSRVIARGSDHEERPRGVRKSMLAEARSNASIATSYLLMARAMLH